MGRYVALLRGINVGKAKRVAMADLARAVKENPLGDIATNPSRLLVAFLALAEA